MCALKAELLPALAANNRGHQWNDRLLPFGS